MSDGSVPVADSELGFLPLGKSFTASMKLSCHPVTLAEPREFDTFEKQLLLLVTSFCKSTSGAGYSRPMKTGAPSACPLMALPRGEQK